MMRAHDVVDAVGAVQDVDDVELGKVHLPWGNNADMALPLDADIGTIAVEAVA